MAVMPGQLALILQPTKRFTRHSEGAFITLANGRILFAWSRFTGGTGDEAAADIACCHSDDGGRTWSTRHRVLIPRGDHANVMSVSFVRLGNGHIGLFYLAKNGWLDTRLWMRTSADEGENWSAPRCCIAAPGYFVVNNDRVIRLSSGRLIAPAAFHRCSSMGPEGFDNRGIMLCYLSDDDGVTWRESRDWWALPVPTDVGLQEPLVVEGRNGRLYACSRTDNGFQWEQWSEDGGDTWTRPRPSRFQSPCSPLSIKRLHDGRWLAAWNHLGMTSPTAKPSSWGRTPLVAAFSNDDGATWTQPAVIEKSPSRGFCYTALFFPDDQHVLMAYCAGGGAHGHVLDTVWIRRIRLKSLYRVPVACSTSPLPPVPNVSSSLIPINS